jgi:ATP-binding cassette, subfamily B, bacterial
MPTRSRTHCTGAALPQTIVPATCASTGSRFPIRTKPTLDEVTSRRKPGQDHRAGRLDRGRQDHRAQPAGAVLRNHSGSITIDGTTIATLAKSSLRDRIGYVTQEPFLFNGTVRENLLLSKRDAAEDDLWTALAGGPRRAFVRNLPKQLDTNVGERGVKALRRRETTAVDRPRPAQKTRRSCCSTRPPPRSIPRPSARSRTRSIT